MSDLMRVNTRKGKRLANLRQYVNPVVGNENGLFFALYVFEDRSIEITACRHCDLSGWRAMATLDQMSVQDIIAALQSLGEIDILEKGEGQDLFFIKLLNGQRVELPTTLLSEVDAMECRLRVYARQTVPTTSRFSFPLSGLEELLQGVSDPTKKGNK